MNLRVLKKQSTTKRIHLMRDLRINVTFVVEKDILARENHSDGRKVVLQRILFVVNARKMVISLECLLANPPKELIVSK